VLRADGGTPRRIDFEPFALKAFVAPAKPVAVEKPRIELGRGAGDQVLLRFTPSPQTRELRLMLRTTAPVADASVNGLPAPVFDRPGRWSRLVWAAPASGLTVAFRPQGSGELEVRYAALADGWPKGAKPLPPRPATLMPWYDSDSTAVVSALRRPW
jgi:hypothetical protein